MFTVIMRRRRYPFLSVILFGSAILLIEYIKSLLLLVEASFVLPSNQKKSVAAVHQPTRRTQRALVQSSQARTASIARRRRRQQQQQHSHHTALYYSSLRKNDSSTDDNDSTTTTTTSPSTEKKKEKNTVIASNFWYSVVTKNQEEEALTANSNNNALKNVVPCVPTLDKDGPLPAGAYVVCQNGNKNSQYYDDEDDVKETCRVAVALDVPFLRRLCQQEQITSLDIAAKLHEYIDAGLSTFHFKTITMSNDPEQQQQQQQQQEWAEENILSVLHRETPSSVMKKCQFVIPLRLSSSQSAVSSSSSSSSSWTPSTVRKLVLGSLMRIGGGDAIDCIQVQYNDGDNKNNNNNKKKKSSSSSSSPYLYDVLDTLNDLKREGVLRSISGRNISANQLRTAKQYGFDIDSNQVDLNLLDPSAYCSLEQTLAACQDLGGDRPLLLASSPLAGGLLTDRYVGRKRQIPPLPWEFTLAERRHWNQDIEVWMKRHGYNNVQDGADKTMIHWWWWQAYQSQILAELEWIALKHRVSVASVALRWTLQLEHIASTIATCRLLYPDDGLKRKDRVQQLRQVFQFELDEEDMKRLWELTGQKQEKELTHRDLDKDERLFEEMMENESGLFVPKDGSDIDFSNKKLWL